MAETSDQNQETILIKREDSSRNDLRIVWTYRVLEDGTHF